MTCRKAGSEMLNTKEQGNLCFVFFPVNLEKAVFLFSHDIRLLLPL